MGLSYGAIQIIRFRSLFTLNTRIESFLLSILGIVVLFGRAMEKWLLASKAETLFRPAPHSVPALKANKKRVIFARMYVAPKDAVPVKGKR